MHYFLLIIFSSSLFHVLRSKKIAPSSHDRSCASPRNKNQLSFRISNAQSQNKARVLEIAQQFSFYARQQKMQPSSNEFRLIFPGLGGCVDF